MLTNSRNLTFGVLVFLSLLVIFQAIPIPQLRSADSTPAPHPKSAEIITDKVNQEVASIYRAHESKQFPPTKAAAGEQGVDIGADGHQAVLQEQHQGVEDPDEEEKLGTQHDESGQDEQETGMEEPQESEGEEQEGDWHKNQVEATQAVTKHKTELLEQEENWHSNQVARAKEAAENHG